MFRTKLAVLLFVAGCVYSVSAVGAPITVLGHINDASSQDTTNNNVGNTTFEALSANGRILAGRGGSGRFSGLFYFQLPALGALEYLGTANLGLTVINDLNTTAGDDVDIYGLGYLTGTPPTAVPGAWHYIGPNDTRTGTTLGTNITAPITKISDDFVLGGGPTTAGTLFETNMAEDVVLTNYLQSLYDSGAVGGDYAIIRASLDTNPGAVLRFDFGSRDNTTPGYQPFLTFDIGTVPEPNSLSLLALGFIGLRIRGIRGKRGKRGKRGTVAFN